LAQKEWIYLFLNFRSKLRRTHNLYRSNRVRFGRSGSSKVVDYGTNRKRARYFLLVINGNLGSMSHRF